MSLKPVHWIIVSLLVVGACGSDDGRFVYGDGTMRDVNAVLGATGGSGGAGNIGSGGSTGGGGSASGGSAESTASGGSIAGGAGFPVGGALAGTSSSQAGGSGGFGGSGAGAGLQPATPTAGLAGTTGGVPGPVTVGGATSGGGAGSATSSGGSAGSATSSGGTPAMPDCQAGTKRCDPAEPILQICSAAGSWQDEACQFVCTNGACAGSCVPGARQCSGLQPQRCDDLGAFVADGAPCAAQCEGGACTGDCRNGATQCAAADAVQTCANGAWGQPVDCQFTCVNGACGGVCEPGAVRCASGTETETCNSMGAWANRAACDRVCVNNACGGDCKPGAKQCSGADLQTCSDQGKWTFSLTCANACVTNKCDGVCRPGAKRCAANGSKTLETCDANGQWTIKSACPGACDNNSCVTCADGESMCESKTAIRHCTAKNEWGAAEDCGNAACVNNACTGECKPGARKCHEEESSALVCNDLGRWGSTFCSGNTSCEAGKCGSFPRTIFTTSKTFNGNLNGLSGADSKCQAAADAAGLKGTYKAWLAAENAPLHERLSTEGGPYRLVDGTLVSPNFFELVSGPVHAIDQDEYGERPPAFTPPTNADAAAAYRCDDEFFNLVWANTFGGFFQFDMCSGFTSTSTTSEDMQFGGWSETNDFDQACLATGSSILPHCTAKAPLYCLQQ